MGLPSSSFSLRFIHSKTTKMTSSNCCCPRRPPLFKIVALLFIFSLISLVLIIKVDDFASEISTQTKTVAGHNLGPTPWHLFPPKQLFNETTTTTYSKASKFIKCSSYLTCRLFGGGGTAAKENIYYIVISIQITHVHLSSVGFTMILSLGHTLSQSSLMEAQQSAASCLSI